jgi:hypothetical protein
MRVRWREVKAWSNFVRRCFKIGQMFLRLAGLFAYIQTVADQGDVLWRRWIAT